MNVWFYAMHVSSIMCKYSFVVIVPIQENLGPFKGEILAGVFTRSRGKNARQNFSFKGAKILFY